MVPGDHISPFPLILQHPPKKPPPKNRPRLTARCITYTPPAVAVCLQKPPVSYAPRLCFARVSRVALRAPLRALSLALAWNSLMVGAHPPTARALMLCAGARIFYILKTRALALVLCIRLLSASYSSPPSFLCAAPVPHFAPPLPRSPLPPI